MYSNQKQPDFYQKHHGPLCLDQLSSVCTTNEKLRLYKDKSICFWICLSFNFWPSLIRPLIHGRCRRSSLMAPLIFEWLLFLKFLHSNWKYGVLYCSGYINTIIVFKALWLSISTKLLCWDFPFSTAGSYNNRSSTTQYT